MACRTELFLGMMVDHMAPLFHTDMVDHLCALVRSHEWAETKVAKDIVLDLQGGEMVKHYIRERMYNNTSRYANGQMRGALDDLDDVERQQLVDNIFENIQDKILDDILRGLMET
jgi:hypothetical protein